MKDMIQRSDEWCVREHGLTWNERNRLANGKNKCVTVLSMSIIKFLIIINIGRLTQQYHYRLIIRASLL